MTKVGRFVVDGVLARLTHGAEAGRARATPLGAFVE